MSRKTIGDIWAEQAKQKHDAEYQEHLDEMQWMADNPWKLRLRIFGVLLVPISFFGFLIYATLTIPNGIIN